MNIDSKSTGQNRGHLRWTFRHAKSLPLAAAVLVLLTIFIAASQSLSASFPVWISPSLVRGGLTDAPGTASSISLSGARGATVDTQVVVQAPAGGLSNVNLSASALTGPGGATIPASNVTLYREYYLSVTGTASYGGGSNPPLGSGTYPEPPIPLKYPATRAPLCGSAAPLQNCGALIHPPPNQPHWIDRCLPHVATNN